ARREGRDRDRERGRSRMTGISALIVDDEPLLRERLKLHLARLWPELAVVGEARHGSEALEMLEVCKPAIVFLDVHMPGLDGIAVAREIGSRAQIVFVTAYEQYALQAFDRGAIDYLVKPFEEARLAQTVERLKSRIGRPPAALEQVLDELAGA